jgi:hypothetical protein
VCYLFLLTHRKSMELLPAISGRWPIPGWFVSFFFEVCFGEGQDGFLPAS